MIERKFEFDEKTKILRVKAVTDETFTLDQIKNIYTDLETKLKQSDEMLKRFKSMKVILLKLQKQPRLKEILEMLVVFMSQIQIPSMENVDKTIKFYAESKIKLEQDMKELKQYYDKVK